MSFRVSQPKSTILTTTPNLLVGGNINIPGYYEEDGTPIKNQFYPALSTATSEKAISTWVASNNTTGSSWNCIAWSPALNMFAMVRQGGTLVNRIVTSSDGGWTWTDRKTTTKVYQGVVWCDDLSGVGMFVSTQGGGIDITISTDGITWTDVSSASFAGLSGFGAIAYSPSLKRVVTVSYDKGYAYSDDGYNWTGVIGTNGGNNFYSLAWSEDLKLFATIGAASKPIQVSPDGIKWTSISPSSPISPSDNNGLVWSPELGIFSGGSGGFIVVSKDGYNWTTYTTPNAPNRNLCWSPQLRMFLSGKTTGIVYSYDGINYFSKNLGFSGAKSSCWSPELGYFLVAGDMAAARISTFRGRPPTSYNVFDSSYNNINELGLWNFDSFGRYTPFLVTSTPYTVLPGHNWIDVSNTTATTVTLPSASDWPGREIMFKSINTQNVLSDTSNNVVLLNGVDLSNNIIPGTAAGRWSTLVSNGTRWEIMQAL